MAETLKFLKKRIRSVKNTRQITKAMEMVSATKLRRTDSVLKTALPFQEKLEELIQRLSQSDDAAKHPMFHSHGIGDSLYVIFAADRGLCGSFNDRIIDFADDLISKDLASGKKISLYLIGKKSKTILKYQKDLPVIGETIDLNGKVSAQEAQEIAQILTDGYFKKKFKEVILIHYSNRAETRFKPISDPLLPCPKPSSAKKDVTDYILEPGLKLIFNTLMAQYVDSKVYTSFLEQLSCEHRNRMITMNKATKNCKELTDSLTLKINKARQGAITKELLDIVGGAEAIK